MLERILNRVKRRDTPAMEWWYWKLRAASTLSFPVVGPLHRALYGERIFRRMLWERLSMGLYYEPLFKSRCERVGRGLRIIRGGGGGMPLIDGSPRIVIGENVQLMDRISLAGMTGFDDPLLTIGDSTYVAAGVLISVARSVTIGSHAMIGAHIVTDNPGHPMLDTFRRLSYARLSPAEVRPVTIGDYAWLATGCYVFPGCSIGDGAIVLPGASVSGMAVPPFTLVGGNPARILAKLSLPSKLAEIVGEERYREYKEVHRGLTIERT